MKKEAASKETKAISRKEKRPKVTIKDVHSLKNRRLLGEYNYKKMIFLTLSTALIILGLFSFILNTILLFQNATAPRFFGSFSALPVVICFFIYYYCYIFKKKQQRIFVSVSFSLYSLAFFFVSDIRYLMSYTLLFFSFILLLFTYQSYKKSLAGIFLFLWGIFVIFSLKFFIKSIKILELYSNDPGYQYFLVCLFLSGGFLFALYLLCNEILERKSIKTRLTNKQLPPRELLFAFMILLQYNKEDICQIMNITPGAYDAFKARVKKRLCIYGELTRSAIRESLNDPLEEKKSDHDTE